MAGRSLPARGLGEEMDSAQIALWCAILAEYQDCYAFAVDGKSQSDCANRIAKDKLVKRLTTISATKRVGASRRSQKLGVIGLQERGPLEGRAH